ncbi:MAG TPA: hypothetical protein VFZ32_16810 [Micromonosporaceae bacterium]
MTVHVVPCGVSIFDGLTRRRDSARGADPTELCDQAASWGQRARQLPDREVIGSWTRDLDRAVDEANLADWGPGVSAETSTLVARAGTSTATNLGLILDDGHAVVLLASDTARGLAAAMAVGYLVTAGASDRIDYLTAVGKLADNHINVRPGRVCVARIASLDPRVRHGFRAATAGIGRVLRAAHDAATAANTDLKVHLTGGYKATLLPVLVMTEVLRSLGNATTTAWYLPDDEDPSGSSEAVEIPLRHFPPEHLELMREELTAVDKGDSPGGASMLQGVAWDIQDDRFRLNAYGVGYLAVFGEPITSPMYTPDGRPL